MKIARAGDGKREADYDLCSYLNSSKHDGMMHFDSELFTENGRCFG
jgi:hypothetical protein